MNWRPHTEIPRSALVTALLATRDTLEGEREPFLLGIYIWRGGRWEDEISGAPGPTKPFWWIPEDELIAELPQ